MTKKQLRALEALPDVIDALTSLAEDAERLRAAMAKASGLGVLPQATAARARPVPPPQEGPVQVVLPTADRAEYESLKANPQPYNPEAEDEPAYKKRQRAMLAAIRNDPRRDEMLSQFKHDTPEAEAG